MHTVYVRFADENLAPVTDVTCMQTGAKREALNEYGRLWNFNIYEKGKETYIACHVIAKK